MTAGKSSRKLRQNNPYFIINGPNDVKGCLEKAAFLGIVILGKRYDDTPHEDIPQQ
jgi:hypothetical protein